MRSMLKILERELLTAPKKIQSATRAGFSDGVASAFRIFGTGRPAPPTVRREMGSLCGDARAIADDGRRLFDEVSA
jgi:hypothetical protein